MKKLVLSFIYPFVLILLLLLCRYIFMNLFTRYIIFPSFNYVNELNPYLIYIALGLLCIVLYGLSAVLFFFIRLINYAISSIFPFNTFTKWSSYLIVFAFFIDNNIKIWRTPEYYNFFIIIETLCLTLLSVGFHYSCILEEEP